MKGGIDIETDFYNMLLDSDLVHTISGGLYRGGARPYDSRSEDVCVSFLSGTIDDGVVSGVVVVNVYIDDSRCCNSCNTDNTSVAMIATPTDRISELEALINDFVYSHSKKDWYWLELDGMPLVMMEEHIKQQYIYVRIKFDTYDNN